MRLTYLPALLLAAAACFATPRARAAEATPITLELNKLEPIPTSGGGAAGCRVYFVVGNPGPVGLDQLRLDLILFGNDGVIARRLAFDLAPLPAKKTAVRLFDLAGLPCDTIGRFLINDVLACQSEAAPGAPADATPEAARDAACLDRITVSSRTKATLAK